MNLTTQLQTCRQQVEKDLIDNLLPFWMEHAKDPVYGGFLGEVGYDMQPVADASKGSLLNARILWTFSAAYKRYSTQAYLDMANYAYNALLELFWDDAYGGFYWSIAADNTPDRTRKQVYGLAFCIYALSEYYSITAKQEALDYAIKTFNLLNKYAYDPKNGGYYEAYTREWKLESDLRLSDKELNSPKSQNTLLHVLEAFTNLLRVWPDATLKAKQHELITIWLDKIINSDTWHAVLFFDEAWTYQSDNVSYGHDIEASWLLTEAAEVLGDEELLERVKPVAVNIAQAVYEQGLAEDGAVLYEATPTSWHDDGKHWWPQSEGMVGFINAYQISGKEHFLQAALTMWDYIDTYMIDRENGGWHQRLSRQNALVTNGDCVKIGFWTCPYHNARGAMETMARIDGMVG